MSKFNTRIQNKFDSLDNWNNSDFNLLSGEIAVATNDDYTRIKIGDGTKSFPEIKDVFIPERAVSAMISNLTPGGGAYLPLSGGTMNYGASIKIPDNNQELYLSIDNSSIGCYEGNFAQWKIKPGLATFYGQIEFPAYEGMQMPSFDGDCFVLGKGSNGSVYLPEIYDGSSKTLATTDHIPDVSKYLPLSGGTMSANAQVKFTTTDPNDVWLSVDGYGISSNYQGTTYKLLGPDPQYDGAFVPREYKGGSSNKGKISFVDGQYPTININNFCVYGRNPSAYNPNSYEGDFNGQYGFGVNYSTVYRDGIILYQGKEYTFPDSAGQLALTSDIPDVPTKTSQLTNDSGFLTAETDPVFTTWKNGNSINLGSTASFGSDSYFDIAIGFATNASMQFGTVVGALSKSTAQFANVFGANANATANYATQIGTGTNSVVSSLQFLNTQIVANGKIPCTSLDDSLSNAINNHVNNISNPHNVHADQIPVEDVWGSTVQEFASNVNGYMGSFPSPSDVLYASSGEEEIRRQGINVEELYINGSKIIVQSEFETHTTDSDIHIESSERTLWNSVSNKADLTALNNYLPKSGGTISGEVEFDTVDTGIRFTGGGSGSNFIYFDETLNGDDGLVFGYNGPEAIHFNWDSSDKTLQSYLDDAHMVDKIATSTTNTINVVPGTKIYQYTVSNSNLITLGGIASNWTDSTKALNVELWIKVPTSGTTVQLPAEPTWTWLETPDLKTTMPNQILYVALRVTSSKTFANLYYTGV